MRSCSSTFGCTAGAGLQSDSSGCRSAPARRVAVSTWACTVASDTGGVAGVVSQAASVTRPASSRADFFMVSLPVVSLILERGRKGFDPCLLEGRTGLELLPPRMDARVFRRRHLVRDDLLVHALHEGHNGNVGQRIALADQPGMLLE